MTNAQRIAKAKKTADGIDFDMAIEATEQLAADYFKRTGKEISKIRYNRNLVEELEALGLA